MLGLLILIIYPFFPFFQPHIMCNFLPRRILMHFTTYMGLLSWFRTLANMLRPPYLTDEFKQLLKSFFNADLLTVTLNFGLQRWESKIFKILHQPEFIFKAKCFVLFPPNVFRLNNKLSHCTRWGNFVWKTLVSCRFRLSLCCCAVTEQRALPKDRGFSR